MRHHLVKADWRRLSPFKGGEEVPVEADERYQPFIIICRY
jgi:hypothetical protein